VSLGKDLISLPCGSLALSVLIKIANRTKANKIINQPISLFVFMLKFYCFLYTFLECVELVIILQMY